MSQIQINVPSVRCQHGKSWAKKVTSVSACPKTGHDYEGPFLSGCGKLDYASPGDVIVCGGFDGSLKNGQKTVDCFIVAPDGRCIQFNYCKSDQWAIRMAPEIRGLLDMTTEERIQSAAVDCLETYASEYQPAALDYFRSLIAAPVDAPPPAPVPTAIPWEGEPPHEVLIGGVLYRRV